MALIGFALVYFLVSSSNSTVTSIFPLQMKGKLNSGLIAGVLNGFCYVGSTISSYGLGLVADAWGWETVFYLLLGVAVAVVVIVLVYNVIKACKKKPQA
jgi:OPA family glycerol-3-phosphate transporter-like MFS transporter